MDWKQIEKDFLEFGNTRTVEEYPKTAGEWAKIVVNWFKQRIESELPPQPPEKLNEEERNEFYTTNVTAEIKPKYGA